MTVRWSKSWGRGTIGTAADQDDVTSQDSQGSKVHPATHKNKQTKMVLREKTSTKINMDIMDTKNPLVFKAGNSSPKPSLWDISRVPAVSFLKYSGYMLDLNKA